MVSPMHQRFNDYEFFMVISHLLVTRPSKSRALECFVVDTARRSTHIAMLVCLLLFCQALTLMHESLDPMVYAGLS